MHCSVEFKRGAFYLQDLGSRFGSSILLDHPNDLTEEHNQFLLQVGRTILECRLMKIRIPIRKINDKYSSLSNDRDFMLFIE